MACTIAKEMYSNVAKYDMFSTLSWRSRHVNQRVHPGSLRKDKWKPPSTPFTLVPYLAVLSPRTSFGR